jgi:hypothetical protein
MAVQYMLHTTSVIALSPFATLGSLAIIFALAITWTRFKDSTIPNGVLKLPGPAPLPIVGNLLQLPRQPLFRTVAEWSKRYGDIWTFTIGRKRFVVLSSVEAMKGCLVERGSSFSR